MQKGKKQILEINFFWKIKEQTNACLLAGERTKQCTQNVKWYKYYRYTNIIPKTDAKRHVGCGKVCSVSLLKLPNFFSEHMDG